MSILYNNSLFERLQILAEVMPHKPALKEVSGKQITFQELVARVDTLASVIHEQGVERGDRVLFLAQPTITGIVYFFAALRAGASVVLADPAMGHSVFRSRVQASKPLHVILDPGLARLRRMPLVAQVLRSRGAAIPDLTVLDELTVIIASQHAAETAPDYDEVTQGDNDEAVIVFTSGTTALPRGVIHTFASLTATLSCITDTFATDSSNIFYSSQLYFTFAALFSGATVLLTGAAIIPPSKLYHYLTDHKVTNVFGTPHEYEELLQYLGEKKLSFPENLREILLGSAPVLTGFLKRLQQAIPASIKVHCVYGATEILPIATISLNEKLRFEGSGDILGRPVAGVSVHAASDGEFLVTGKNLAHGYIDSGSFRVYHSGDVGEIDASGNLILKSRKKDMIIKGTHNIYPTLFESTISNIPGIKKSAMIGLYNDHDSDEKIYLVIEPEQDVTPREHMKEVKQALRNGPYSIDQYAWPDEIMYMNIPVTGRGNKIDKDALKSMVFQKVWKLQ